MHAVKLQVDISEDLCNVIVITNHRDTNIKRLVVPPQGGRNGSDTTSDTEGTSGIAPADGALVEVPN